MASFWERCAEKRAPEMTMQTIGKILEKQGGTDRYKGFPRPNTTPTPDDLFDIFLSTLTHAELKVLLYIIRRTFGFKKACDRISLKQLCTGIVTKGGKRLDSGTGLSRQGAITTVKSLEKRGLIVVERIRTQDGYNKVNIYRLKFRQG